MSALELYLREVKKTGGIWHKKVLSNLREYLRTQSEEAIISAINKLQDGSLIPYLWEVGISQHLQDVANQRSQTLAGSTNQEVI